MDTFLKRGQFKSSNGNLIRKSINPLSIPQEFKSNLQRSNILDASLLELPNISIDKTNENENLQLSITDKILIEKFKDNEIEIFEFIKNQECQNRLLLINKSKFSELFKIKDQLMLENIFNIYKIVQKTSSRNSLINNNNNNNTLPSSFKNKVGNRLLKRKSSNNNILNENKIDDISRNEIENTLKIPIGGNSFPIPVENNNNNNNYISDSDNNNNNKIDSIHSSPIEVNKRITETIQASPSSSCSSSSINTGSILSDCSQSNSLTSSSLYSGISSTTSLDGSNNNYKNDKDLTIVESKIENGKSDCIVENNSSTTITSNNEISITPTNNSTFNTPINDNPDFLQHAQSLPIIKAIPSPTTTKIFKSKSFSSSSSFTINKSYNNHKKIKKSKTFQIDQKINIFDIINQIYLNISKIGSSENERIESIFKLYDIYNQGFISRNHLKEVLIYRTRQSGLKFQDFTMESLIDHIFEQFDKNLDGFIDFEEFKNELTIKEPSIEKEVEKDDDYDQVRIKQDDKLINESFKNNNNNKLEDNNITTTTTTTTSNNDILVISSIGNRLKRYLKIEGSKLFFICLFLIINSILGVISFIGVHNNNKKALDLFGPGLYITRIAAQLILFNAAIILVTMCKQLFTMIRNTRFKSLFPVDKYMTFHKLIGYTLIIASFLHTIGWFVGMAIATGKPDSVFYECLSPHFKFRPTVWEMIFNSLPGVTGFIMVSILTIMGAFSLKIVRKSSFELFYYSHHLFIAFYILLILHGTMGWIRPPTFWKWFIVPAVLYSADRGYRLFKRTYRVEVVDFSLKNERVINLAFNKPSSFNYKPGQYLLINIPKISKLQWHPFTMTSSPLEDTIQVHIRVTGGWTKKLFKMLTLKKQQLAQADQIANQIETLNFDVEIASKSIYINIDGPFGSSSQYALNQKQVILVGAGIGVAPMASLLKDISLKKQRLAYLDPSNIIDQQSMEIIEQSKNQITTKYGLGNLEKVHFFWLNRDQYSFQWFEDLLVDISRNSNSSELPKISINTFNTRVFPRNDVRMFMLWNGYNKLFKENGLDPTTNLPFKTHWGRPNWDTIFQYYSRKYSGESISVFCCGPPQLSKQLYEKCRKYTNLKSNGTKFYFHKENF